MTIVKKTQVPNEIYKKCLRAYHLIAATNY